MRRIILAALPVTGVAVLVTFAITLLTFAIVATTSIVGRQPANTGDDTAPSPMAPSAAGGSETPSPTVAPTAHPTAVTTGTATTTPISPAPLTEAERYRAALEARDEGDRETATQQLEAISQAGALSLFSDNFNWLKSWRRWVTTRLPSKPSR